MINLSGKIVKIFYPYFREDLSLFQGESEAFRRDRFHRRAHRSHSPKRRPLHPPLWALCLTDTRHMEQQAASGAPGRQRLACGSLHSRHSRRTAAPGAGGPTQHCLFHMGSAHRQSLRSRSPSLPSLPRPDEDPRPSHQNRSRPARAPASGRKGGNDPCPLSV